MDPSDQMESEDTPFITPSQKRRGRPPKKTAKKKEGNEIDTGEYTEVSDSMDSDSQLSTNTNILNVLHSDRDTHTRTPADIQNTHSMNKPHASSSSTTQTPTQRNTNITQTPQIFTPTYKNYKYTYTLQTRENLSRIQLAAIWNKWQPNNDDIIISTPNHFLLKTNKALEPLLIKLLNENILRAFKLFTPNTNAYSSANPRGADSYSVIITGVETEIADEEISQQLKAKNFQFRFCKRIISKATNRPTPLIRVITGDVTSFERMLATGGLFYLNRLYKIIPSNSPKPIPIPCGKCSAFDHTTDHCKAQKKCTKCYGQHDTNNCSSPLPPKCAACDSMDHAAWSARCPKRPTAPIPGIPNVKIRSSNKKTADIAQDKTKRNRLHTNITIHDFIINKYTNALNNPKHTNRDELIQKLRKRFIDNFNIDTKTMFSGNYLYILMFDLEHPQSTSPTEPTDNIRQTIISNTNG